MRKLKLESRAKLNLEDLASRIGSQVNVAEIRACRILFTNLQEVDIRNTV